MNPLRVLICDDEPLAVRRLATMVSRIDGVDVVATASTGREAIAAFQRLSPALMLLDIEMPEENGFDVVDAISSMDLAEPPLFAFVTAFRRFASDAFECGAIDFLPKPVRQGRLEATIARTRLAIAGREARVRLDDLEQRIQLYRGGPVVDRPHVWVTRRGELLRIELEDLDRISAEGAYIRLHVGGATYLHREPLADVATRLDPSRFVRVHRSHLIRTDQLSSIRRTVHGGSEILLVTGEVIPIGRKYARDARQRLTASRNRPGGDGK